MKTHYVLILTLGMIPLNSHARDFLTQAQSKKVLRQIDNTCADTWCEGDDGYRFRALTCDSETKECKVVFDIITDNEKKPVKVSDTAKFTAVVSPIRHVACTIKGVSKYADLMAVDEVDLNDSFYDPLNDCIDALTK